ncbi:MAG: UspA domain-containing protein [Bacteroidetes bacterium OLB12]|nr:MAG: UspA domain-containing protein [Bacteroidetes bacterium OLB12]HNR73912.1 universal stress protein [Cyclobacteriaceae bacterium]HNU42242.1 universal stress protein [Cyclobacteriaceae bacterium]
MKKILVPTDFSKISIGALEVAAEIAKKSNAELTLLHVVEQASSSSFSVTGEWRKEDWADRLYTIKLLEKSKAQLEKLVMDPRFEEIKITGELRVGNAFHGMRTIITENKVDLVVMGTHGRAGAVETIIGTNTERVVRHAKCPVLSINKKPARVDFKNIVYATAMHKDEEIFSRMVKKTQQLYNSTVHLVRINTPGDFQRDYVVKDYMEKFAKKLGLKNYTINVFNDITEEDGIIYFAETIDADLIAMATHGRTGFAHVLAGSIAEDVVGHAKRPVLTFVVKR